MSVEHFYWFVDRAALDPILQMRWKDFLRKYPFRKGEFESFAEFVIEPQPSATDIASLASKTLRSTMRRASPADYFLNTIAHQVPHLKKQCPEVWVNREDSWAAEAGLIAASVHAFLEGVLDERSLWAAYNVAGSYNPQDFLALRRTEIRRIEFALGYGAMDRPIYSWQLPDEHDSGYQHLRVRDCKRFMNFLRRAWKENWQTPRIKQDIPLPDTPESSLSFRGFPLHKQLVNCLASWRPMTPCLIRYRG